jgi:O-antigen ligase
MYLSETGIPGLLIFLLLLYLVFSRALKIYRTADDKPLKWLAFAILLGFISFIIHGAVNSFLDTDKASVLFYPAIAAIVAIEILHHGASNPLPADTDPGERADVPAK